MYLVADIGGTRSRFYALDGEKIVFEHVYSSKDYQNFMHIIEDFKVKTAFHYQAFVFGIAGAVINGVCKATNLPWEVHLEAIKEKTRIHEGYLINDLELLSYGALCVEPHMLEVLQTGEKIQGNSMLVCPGTGLGVACVTDTKPSFKVLATESGHADFAPLDVLQTKMLEQFWRVFGHVSIERFVSGSGLLNVYKFLCVHEKEKEVLSTSEEITEAALAKSDPIALKTCQLFIDMLAAELGNLALHFMPYQGIYLCGALLRRLHPLIDKAAFTEKLSQKGRFHHLLKKIPVYVIKEQKLAPMAALNFFKHHKH